MKRALIALLLASSMAWIVGTAPAHAQARDVDARAAVEAALIHSSATQAAELRVMDERLRTQRRRIVSLEAEVNTGRARLEELTAERRSYVAALADRDTGYAQAIAAFRSNVVQIASSPERLEILSQRRPGNLAPARNALDRLVRDQRAAGAYSSDGAYLADLRALAAITLDDRDRGEATTDDALIRFEEITRLDPNASADWGRLATLYLEAGSVASAQRANQRSAETATAPGDRAAAFERLAAIAVAQSDFRAALDAANQSIEARRTLARDADLASLIGLSNTLALIADAQMRQSERTSAAAIFDEALTIARRVVQLSPQTPELQRPLTILLGAKAMLAFQGGNIEGAVTLQDEALEISRRLLAADPTSEARARDLEDGLQRMTQFTSWAESSAPPITDGASQYRDYSRTSALAIERETLALRQLENNPNSEGALRNAIQASAVAAQMRSTNRDYAGARQTHLRAIDLCERLLALLPGDHTAQTDLDREIAYVAATFGTPASMASNGRDRARAIAIAIAEEGVLAIRTYMRDSPDHPAWLLALASLLDHVATTQGYERQYPLALAPLEERLQLLQRYAVLRPNDPNIARLIGRATRDLERLRVQLAR